MLDARYNRRMRTGLLIVAFGSLLAAVACVGSTGHPDRRRSLRNTCSPSKWLLRRNSTFEAVDPLPTSKEFHSGDMITIALNYTRAQWASFGAGFRGVLALC